VINGLNNGIATPGDSLIETTFDVSIAHGISHIKLNLRAILLGRWQ
jgi:hypothetical protein